MNEQKNKYQAELFFNRISKNYKKLCKWARKNRISCYRLYDKDIPEVPLCLEVYTFLPDEIESKTDASKYFAELNSAISENGEKAKQLLENEKTRTYATLYLYERPYEKSEAEENLWLEQMSEQASKVLGISKNHVIQKMRKRQRDRKGNRNQYEKNQNLNSVKGKILEQGQLFFVNLTDYIDTGLFFDHRPLRAIVRDTCKNKRVLNLFCYTGGFSVYAAEGKANFVESVDMSKTYLDWAKKNLELNNFSSEAYKITRSDVFHYLNDKENTKQEKFDIIILDPPTLSNSKNTDSTLDLNRDWNLLVESCIKLLSRNGILYFSTNSRRLKFDENLLPIGTKAQEITESTIPEDYRNSKIHRAWKITIN